MIERIADKIAKLIAKADSTSHAAEADLFMSKAHELLQAHGLSLLDLGKLGDDPVGIDRDLFDTPSYPWIHRVASPLVKYYGCEFVRVPRGPRMSYSVAGRESNRITFMLMLPFVQRQIQKLAQQAYKEGRYPTVAKAANKIADATAARLWKMVPETKKHHGSGPNALVPVDLIQQLIDDTFSNTKTPRRRVLEFDQYAAAQAKKISVNRQTGTVAPARRITT